MCPSERFYVSDAVEVLNWAQEPEHQPWVRLLSFWSLNRDNGGCPGGPAQSGCSGVAQEKFEFTQTWLDFSGEGSGSYLPTVSIVNPADQDVFEEGETIGVIADAQDPDGQITQVTFFINGNPSGTDTVAPYTLTLPGLFTGIYDLRAQATDNDGGTRISVPVRIFVGDVCTATQWKASSIYVASNQVSHNGHTWEAKWWTQGDEPGTTGQWGVWMDLGLCQVSSNVPPEAAITSPVAGALFDAGDDVTFSASATDPDGSVARVAFFIGTDSLGTVTSAPFTLTLTDIQEGVYNLTAVATDNEGATGISQAVEIVVGDVCSVPLWKASSIYVARNQVSHNGHMWEAKWWTRGDEPGTTGRWGVWVDLGNCGGDL